MVIFILKKKKKILQYFAQCMLAKFPSFCTIMHWKIYNFYWSATSSDAPDVGTLFAWAVSIFFSNRIRSENKIFVWWIQTNIPDSLSWLSRRKVFSIKNFFWNSEYIFTCRSHRAQLASKELCTYLDRYLRSSII